MSLDTLGYNKMDQHRVILERDITNNRFIKVLWRVCVCVINWINCFGLNTLTVLKSNNSTLFDHYLSMIQSILIKYTMTNLNKNNYI